MPHCRSISSPAGSPCEHRPRAARSPAGQHYVGGLLRTAATLPAPSRRWRLGAGRWPHGHDVGTRLPAATRPSTAPRRGGKRPGNEPLSVPEQSPRCSEHIALGPPKFAGISAVTVPRLPDRPLQLAPRLLGRPGAGCRRGLPAGLEAARRLPRAGGCTTP